MPDGTQLAAKLHQGRLFIDTVGPSHSVIEVGEQFAWLGAALRSSPSNVEIACCKPLVSGRAVPIQDGSGTVSNTFIEVTYSVRLRERRSRELNGQCWQHMFRNPAIAEGFPIRRRNKLYPGLELSLGMMADLARAQRAVTFGGQLLIKGFCTLLVATKLAQDMVLWHMLYNVDGDHINYADPRVRQVLGDGPVSASSETLETARHVLGWCSDVDNYTGKLKYALYFAQLPVHGFCSYEKPMRT